MRKKNHKVRITRYALRITHYVLPNFVVKNVIVYMVEGIFILFLAIIVLIGLTGGFSFSLGSLTIKVHRFTNPLIILITTLLLRRFLIGSFFRHPIFDRLAQRFVASQHFRNRLIAALLILIGCIVLAVVSNPLKHGLIGRYYDNHEWAGSPMMTTRDQVVNLWRMKSEYPDKLENYSIQWTGVIFIPASGEYQFATISDDGSELDINDQLVVDNRGLHGFQERSGKISLEKGVYPIKIRYMQGDGGAEFKAYWKRPGKKREMLSQASLFVEEPTQMAFSIGHFLEILLPVCQFLCLMGFISFALISFGSHHILLPFLRSSGIGKVYWACRSRIVKEGIEKQGFPASPQKSVVVLLVAFVGYTLLSFAWTYPLIVNFSTKMIGYGGDRYIYIWNMWWMKKALVELHTNPLFTDYIFYPKGISLTFHDFSIFNSFVSIPLQGIFTLEEIYNILFLLTFILGGFGCFLLVRYLTGDHLAAFLSGIIFGFWGGRMYYVDHLSLASIQWFPYCALYLIKTVRERSYRNPVLAAIFLAINALSAWYYAVYMSLFTALFLCYTAWAERTTFFTRSCLKRIGLIGILFIVIMFPLLYPMMTEIFGGQDYMQSQLFAEESASPNVLFFPNINHDILGKYVRYFYIKFDLPIQWGLAGGSFIGYTVLILCFYTGFKVRHLKQGFWIIAAVFFLVLSFGPHLMLFSKHYTWIPLPYLLLQRIPILKIVRIPIRFMVMVMFSCSILAGYACWDIFRKIRIRKTLFLILTVLILFEFVRFYYAVPVEGAPDFYKKIGQDPETYAILELTQLMNWVPASVRASLFQTIHEKKLFQGHASRVPFETYHQAYALYIVFGDLFTQPQEHVQTNDRNLSLGANKEAINALLSFYNVRYVALYNDFWYGDYQGNWNRLREVFGDPIDKQKGIALFKVDNTTLSANLVFPGFGLSPPQLAKDGIPIRQAARSADIKLLNVNQSQKVQIRFQGQSYDAPKEDQVQIFVNDTLVTTATIGDWTEVTIPPVAIEPGENTIKFRMPGTNYDNWKYGFFLRNVEIELL
jgi:hypothetical protein